MNTSFIIFGLTMFIGSILIYQEFKRTKLSLFGFALMAASGVGTIMVGLFPENVNYDLHRIGASLGLGVGSLSIVVLAFGLKQIASGFRFYSFASGIVSLAAFILFVSGNYLMLGRGGIERLISYPFTIWLISLGLYMSAVRIMARSKK